PGGVFFQRSVRRRAPAAPLVEQYDAVSAWIVIAPHHRVNAAARAAMQQHGGLADRRAAFLEIDLVQVGDLEPARPVRDDLRVEREPRVLRCKLVVHGVLSGRLTRPRRQEPQGRTDPPLPRRRRAAVRDHKSPRHPDCACLRNRSVRPWTKSANKDLWPRPQRGREQCRPGSRREWWAWSLWRRSRRPKRLQRP